MYGLVSPLHCSDCNWCTSQCIYWYTAVYSSTVRENKTNNVTNMCHARAAVLPVQPEGLAGIVCLFIIIISFRLVKLKKATVQQQLDARCPQSPIFRSKGNPAGKKG